MASVRPFTDSRRGGVEEALERRLRELRRIRDERMSFAWLVGGTVEEAIDRLLTATIEHTVLARPGVIGAKLRRVEQLEGAFAERRASAAETAERIGCFTWIVRFDVTGPYDLLGQLRADTALGTYPGDVLSPPPAITWGLDGDVLKATCWVEAEGTESDTPPADLMKEAQEYVDRWVAETNDSIESWTQATEAELRGTIAARHAKALEAAKRVADLNEILGTGQEEEIDIRDPAEVAAELDQTARHERPIALPHLISDANVEAIVRVINRWSNAIEDDQGAFQPLVEQQHSGLLVATLRGAFGRAAREVFVGKGKLDFQVTGNDLEDDGLPLAFGGEVKIWSGEVGFLDAVQQKLDNCTSHTPDGILLVIVRNRKSFDDARETGLAAMRERYQEVDPVSTRPAFLVPRPADPNHLVRLTVVFVDETRTDEHKAKA